MRSHILPVRYYRFLLLIIVVMVLAEFFASASESFILVVVSPFAGTIFGKIFNTLFLAILILILYTAGAYLIVRKMPDEASRFTAIRIFTVILLGLGLLLGLMEWVEDPAQFVLFLGIIWVIFYLIRQAVRDKKPNYRRNIPSYPGDYEN
jgi:hypothetical protein